MPLNPFDNTGSRIRRDSEALAAELASLVTDGEREATAAFISAALDVEEIEAEQAAGEAELRRRQRTADAAIMAATANPTTDRIDELRRVIAAQRRSPEAL